jgi:hypothetical protein
VISGVPLHRRQTCGVFLAASTSEARASNQEDHPHSEHSNSTVPVGRMKSTSGFLSDMALLHCILVLKVLHERLRVEPFPGDFFAQVLRIQEVPLGMNFGL